MEDACLRASSQASRWLLSRATAKAASANRSARVFVRATRYPRLLGSTGLGRLLVEELLDKLSMGLVGQAPADHPLGGLDGEARHLAPQLGHRLGTLRLRLLAGGLDD